MISSERREEVVKLKEAGRSYRAIGHRIGVSGTRARQIEKGNPKPPRKPNLESSLMLTTSEAARLIGVHANTIRRWTKQGLLKPYRISPRGDRRFRREDVNRFLGERG